MLAIVVPCYNEVEALPRTAEVLSGIVRRLVDADAIDAQSRVWYVDDGSRDGTWPLIERLCAEPVMRANGIRLSRNRGHQVALLSGLMTAEGDAVVSIDADLQDDPEVVVRMVERFNSGIDIVYGVRVDRTTDSRFKRISAEAFYRILRWAGAEVVFNHADYRLMSRRAVEALRAHGEANIFLRGLVPQLGFPSTTVDYVRAERREGDSKYPLSRMVGLAWQGITSFTAAPLRAITLMGFSISLLSILAAVWALVMKMFTDLTIPGWASTVIPMFLLAGFQFLALGVIGEYLAKVFIETKRRPAYFIDSVVRSSAVHTGQGGRAHG